MLLVGLYFQSVILSMIHEDMDRRTLLSVAGLESGILSFVQLSEKMASQTLAMAEAFLPSHGDEGNQLLAQLLPLAPWMESLEILDRNGRVIYQAPENLGTQGFEYSRQEYVRALGEADSRTIYWSPSYVSPRTQKTTATMALRGSRFDLIIALDLDKMGGETSHLASQFVSGMTYAILDSKGVYLAASDSEKVRVRETSPWFPSLKAALEKGDNWLELQEKGTRHRVHALAVHHTGWTVVVSDNLDRTYETSRSVTLVLGSLLGSWLLFSFGLTWWLLSTWNRTIGSLTAHAQAIAGGRYTTMDHGIPWKDFHILTESMNEMVTAIQQRDGQLNAKNAELERFTYTVSHDLKSPLITISGFQGLVVQDLDNQNIPRAKADLEKIRNAADKMTHLLTDLLELSRIGRMINPSTSFNMAEVVKETQELLEVPLQTAEVWGVDSWPEVKADRTRLREVWQNLAENALKYRKPQQNLRLEWGWETRGPETVFYLRDNGMGIPPAYRDRVFGLFEKLDARSAGTGIGLALVKRIIEFHGGRIWVEDGPEGGSTFCFTLGNPGA